MTPPLSLDIVGDVHGHLAALQRLLEELGHGADGRSHPEGRLLLFLGDLVDRGPHSLETCELVLDLQRRGRALLLMGNHELNLVRTAWGLDPIRESNRSTVADLAARTSRWDAVLPELAAAPLAWQCGDLRVVHAVWHEPSVARLLPLLGRTSQAWTERDGPLGQHVVLRSPLSASAPLHDLPAETYGAGDEVAHEVLVKGYEERVEPPFVDGDGKLRHARRVCWWLDEHAAVPRSGRTIFGHYWHLPPRTGADRLAPPYPTGHPSAEDWIARHHQQLQPKGRWPVPASADAVCIDFNGVWKHHSVGCVGAYRHPEAEIAWASA